MARDPKVLSSQILDEEKKFVDDLEKRIDERMDREYDGGIFTFHASKSIKERVLKEIQRRYSKWTVQYEKKVDGNLYCDPRDSGIEYILTFTPHN